MPGWQTAIRPRSAWSDQLSGRESHPLEICPWHGARLLTPWAVAIEYSNQTEEGKAAARLRAHSPRPASAAAPARASDDGSGTEATPTLTVRLSAPVPRAPGPGVRPGC